MSEFTPTDIAPDALREETDLSLTDDEIADLGFMAGYFGHDYDPPGTDREVRRVYATAFSRGFNERRTDLATPGR